MRLTIRRALAFFLPGAVVATLGCLLLYGTVQQVLRQGADDPQHQLAEDAVASLTSGGSPASVVGSAQIEIGTSLAPFVVVYDTSGSILASGATLDGTPPTPPAGVLATALETGIDRVTWQPQPGIRIATVVLRWSGGTVLAGRSLRRVEEITASIGALIVAGWVVLVGAIAAASFVSARIWPSARVGSP